ncbi:hypothetical protein ACFVZR_35820 [Streptomyces sp. NPDC058316]|uniref:hypothetical protein n=1 Tax=unclassified Streptomyces TaxID=2593676 RepID=UPI003329F296
MADGTAALLDEVFMAEYAEMCCQHTKAQTVDSPAIAKAYRHVPDLLAHTLDSTPDRYRGLPASR